MAYIEIEDDHATICFPYNRYMYCYRIKEYELFDPGSKYVFVNTLKIKGRLPVRKFNFDFSSSQLSAHMCMIVKVTLDSCLP